MKSRKAGDREPRVAKHQRPSSKNRTRRTTYHHGNLRPQMIESARTLLEEKGLSALSLRSAAAHAGVTPAAPLHHFGDKQGLLAAVAATGFRELVDQRTQHIAKAGSKEERLRIVLTDYVRFAMRNREMFHLMFSPQIPDKRAYPELLAAAHASYDLLRRMVADVVSAGLDASQIDILVRCVWATTHGLAMQLADRTQVPRTAPALEVESWINAVVDFAVIGLKAAARQLSAARQAA